MQLTVAQKDRILGFALGTAIGDALGVPTETLTPAEINEKFGYVTDYKSTEWHKWAHGKPTGATSDDWQLTKLVMDSVAEYGGVNMDDIAKRHIEALKDDRGWGGSTKEAVKRLMTGIDWRLSGQLANKPNRGFGNGVAMKVGGIALWSALRRLAGSVDDFPLPPLTIPGVGMALRQFARMTHATPIGVAQAFAHLAAIEYCFYRKPVEFSAETFLADIELAAVIGHEIYARGYTGFPKLHAQIARLRDWRSEEFTPQNVIETFGSGFSAELSLPSAYAFLIQNPTGIEPLYHAVNGGGDTDSVGALVGGMLGALNGSSIFPQHLVDGLYDRVEVMATVTNFIAGMERI